MKTKRQSFKNLLAIASLSLALPAMAAQPGTDDGGRCERHGGEMGERGGPMMMPGDGMMGPMPPFLHGLNLTEEQRDAIFNITYKQALAMRDKEKSLHKAHEALHALVMSGKFDETKARSLAQEVADNLGAITLLRAKVESDIYAVLVPEQRKKIAEAKAQDGREEFRSIHGQFPKKRFDMRSI